MKVILTIAGLAPEFGGPSRSVPALAEALARGNVDVDLLACESQSGHSPPVLPDAAIVRTHLLPARSREGRWRTRRNDFFSAISERARSADTVVHDNGLWLPTNHAVASAALNLKRPLVISPRGMLSEWASTHHGWKKKIAWTLFQRRDLLSASALHATSEREVDEARYAGFRGAVALVSNGIDLPELNNRSNIPGPTHNALCIARLHRVKGLMNLIEAWGAVRPEGWRMVIAGSDEDRHRAELEPLIAAHELKSVFEFVGPVEGEKKEALYREANLFILPSHSENFGMGIAEALANAVPVITTHGTPWRELVEHRCGWWEEIGIAPLARALQEAVSLTDEQRRAMGQRGRKLVENNYSWRRVATEMKSVYAWLLGQGKRPACVTLS